ncbi:MAG: hypothetical protein HY553_20935 [Elusimicrobia bacterium]|nr:hypothetical protein [Elusimicrobiota bacterium]
MFAALLAVVLALPAVAAERKLKVIPTKHPKGERARPERPPTSDYGVVPPTSVPREVSQPTQPQPWPVRLMVHNIERGMFIGLPIVDTDPNRGVTMGFMPIWVIQKPGGDRIASIWAPSVSYNKTFKATPVFRYYTYPTRESNLTLRGSISQVSDREAMGEWHDRDFRGTGWESGLRLQYNIDGSRRFFGIGPDTSINAESNYKEEFWLVRSLIGAPIKSPDTGWMAKLSHTLLAMKIADGPIDAIPSIRRGFSGFVPERYRQVSNVKLGIDYDSRDHDVTTTEGSYGGFFVESSQRPIGSQYAYQEYAFDFRHTRPWKRLPKHGTSGMFKFRQIKGEAPFWVMPQLGSKYVHRAYGEGRYIDRGMFTLQLEHRYTAASVKTAGVTTEFQVAPFAGIGSVFHSAPLVQAKHVRPVFGGAVRAVAKPQVVGSVDFGVGQEGMTAFMDINYSW